MLDDEDAVRAGKLLAGNRDKLTPTYEILYSQDVTTEDVYMGNTEKTPSVDDCNKLTIKISLPKHTNMSECSLEVCPRHLLLVNPTHVLAITLPKNVRNNDGRARWDKSKATLAITVPLSA
eukprot:GHVS01021010.1.p1 GENE.GHVS01021010.1~~GHVS01021010.1.p1  ORF type:complete len:121 (-),score=14.80 GHVS01021010.1:275-637(-)